MADSKQPQGDFGSQGGRGKGQGGKGGGSCRKGGRGGENRGQGGRGGGSVDLGGKCSDGGEGEGNPEGRGAGSDSQKERGGGDHSCSQGELAEDGGNQGEIEGGIQGGSGRRSGHKRRRGSDSHGGRGRGSGTKGGKAGDERYGGQIGQKGEEGKVEESKADEISSGIDECDVYTQAKVSEEVTVVAGHGKGSQEVNKSEKRRPRTHKGQPKQMEKTDNRRGSKTDEIPSSMEDQDINTQAEICEEVTVVNVHGEVSQELVTTQTKSHRACRDQKKQMKKEDNREESKADEIPRSISDQDVYSQAEIKEEVTGRVIVVNLLKHFGFILPDKKLPAPYDKENKVHFHYSSVKGKPLKMHCRVAFKLKLEKVDKPSVLYARSLSSSKDRDTDSKADEGAESLLMEKFTYPEYEHAGSKGPDQETKDVPCTKPCHGEGFQELDTNQTKLERACKGQKKKMEKTDNREELNADEIPRSMDDQDVYTKAEVREEGTEVAVHKQGSENVDTTPTKLLKAHKGQKKEMERTVKRKDSQTIEIQSNIADQDVYTQADIREKVMEINKTEEITQRSCKGQLKQMDKKGNRGESKTDEILNDMDDQDVYTQAEINEEVAGRVVNLHKGFGFILPDKKLPEPYDKENKVHFYYSSVKGKPLKMHCRVAFKLKLEKVDKPSVLYARSLPSSKDQDSVSKADEGAEASFMEMFTYPECGHAGSKRPDQEIKDVPCTKPCHGEGFQELDTNQTKSQRACTGQKKKVENTDIREESNADEIPSSMPDQGINTLAEVREEGTEVAVHKQGSQDVDATQTKLLKAHKGQKKKMEKKVKRKDSQTMEIQSNIADQDVYTQADIREKVTEVNKTEEITQRTCKGQLKQMDKKGNRGESKTDEIPNDMDDQDVYTQAEINEEVAGRVVNLHKGFGFILPDKKLPEPYDKENKVHFYYSSVKGKPLKMHCRVAFKLKLEKVDKPCVLYARSLPTDKDHDSVSKAAEGAETSSMEKFRYPECVHAGSKRSDEEIKDLPCTKPCSKTMHCGHKCQKLYHEKCAKTPGECPLCINKGQSEKGKKHDKMQQKETLIKEIKDELEKMKKGQRVKKTFFICTEVNAKVEINRFKYQVKQFLGAQAEIDAVFEVNNPFLREKWLQARLEMNEPLNHHKRLLVVPCDVADKVLKNGFEMMQKSSQERESTYSGKEDKVLLYCDVLSGRPYTVKDDILSVEELKKGKYDTMYFSRMVLPVPKECIVVARHAVYDPHLVLVTHMVHYKMPVVTEEDAMSTSGHSDHESASSSIDIPVNTEIYPDSAIEGILFGIIVKVRKGIGFLRPEKKLPSPYNQERDIYFLPEEIGADRINEGERVVFLLQKGTLQKPSVLDIELMSSENPAIPYIRIDCGHIAFLDKSGRMDSNSCQKQCTQTLMCGHQCKQLCSEMCLQMCAQCTERETSIEMGNLQEGPIQTPNAGVGLSETLARKDIIRDCASRLQELSSIKVNLQNVILPFDFSEEQKNAVESRIYQEVGECKLKSVHRVENPAVEVRWLRARMAMNNPCSIAENQLYRTDELKALEIAKHGFNMEDLDTKKVETSLSSSSSSTLALLLCDVLTGNALKYMQGSPVPDAYFLTASGFDSLLIPEQCDMKINAFKFGEIHVFNPDLIYPKFILNFQLGTEKKESTADMMEMGAARSAFRLIAKHGFGISNPLDTYNPEVESRFLRFLQKMEDDSPMEATKSASVIPKEETTVPVSIEDVGSRINIALKKNLVDLKQLDLSSIMNHIYSWDILTEDRLDSLQKKEHEEEKLAFLVKQLRLRDHKHRVRFAKAILETDQQYVLKFLDVTKEEIDAIREGE